MLAVYLTAAVIHKQFWWPLDVSAYSHPATWVVPVTVNVLLVVSIKLWAVHAVHGWQYSSMPLVPFIHVGVTPVLQMLVISLAATRLCHRVAMPR